MAQRNGGGTAGGARPGSGRRRSLGGEDFRVSVRLDARARRNLLAYCARTGKYQSAAIREILWRLEYYTSPPPRRPM